MRFVAPVQIVLKDSAFVAESCNLSLGGMLLHTQVVLPPGTDLRVSFSLPTGAKVQAAARVIHCRAGVRLGIEFTGLEHAAWDALCHYVNIDDSLQRRSIRIPERLFVRLFCKQDERRAEWPAETLLLSRHGCLLWSRIAPPPSDTNLVIWYPERRVAARARVVFRREEADNSWTFAVEFASNANFWGLDF